MSCKGFYFSRSETDHFPSPWDTGRAPLPRCYTGYKMAASLGRLGCVSRCVFYLMLSLELSNSFGLCSDALCPQNCTCRGDSVDCSGLELTVPPLDLPVRTVSLNLGHNKLASFSPEAFANLPNLRELRLDHNELTSIPDLGQAASRIVSLYLHHNKIRIIDGSRTTELVSVETLDLSNNEITDVRADGFPAGLQIRDLYLGNNKISTLQLGALDHLGSTLQVLRLSRNRISQIPIRAFQLPRLTQLELNRNRIHQIEGLTFQGLSSLEVLKLQRNSISKLTDGAFWNLSKMKVLHLEYNNLTEVNSGSLYGLSSLTQLFLSNNSMARINADGWKFCQRLRELNLSYNNLTRLDEGSLAVLGDLHTLRLGHNSISHINEGAFRGLKALRVLELDHNDISGTIEDTNGAFTGLDKLNKLTLFGNKIKSVAKKAFAGLETLEHLNLGQNAIRSIQLDAFSKMGNIKSLLIQSNSFLCDCQLRWLPIWLQMHGLQAGVNATCAHPVSLQGTSIFEAPQNSFVCDDLPKPQITVQPENTVTMLGSDVRLTCTAASSSSSPMTFAWRKDQELIRQGEMENFAHVRTHHKGATPDTSGMGGGVMEYTTILHLRHATFAHEGRYQCIITNHFGSTYSNKAQVVVNVLPSFLKTPRDSTIRMGNTARLECAAEGHPAPQIAWQKDGGTDFPAARERRMHVMPDDDVFFIMDVKPEDMGMYSCTAKNTAGTVSANATLTVLETPHLAQEMEDRSVAVGDTVALQCKALGSPTPRITWLHNDQPLQPSDRHYFTPGNQLLIIRSASMEDTGRYTCLMSNTLGTERAHSQLVVTQRRSVCVSPAGLSTVTIGIIVIAVVTSIVATSLVWVCIIYQTRKKSEECSVTNTDETIVPPDVPSYLSSQGTLSERQDVCIRVEAGSGAQPNGHVVDTSGFDGAVMCTDCMETGNSYGDADYLTHGYGLARGGEYQQQQIAPPRYSQCNLGEQRDPGSHLAAPLCNGTPHGIRKDMQGSTYPKNHNTIERSQNNRKASRVGHTLVGCPSQDDSFHEPVKLAGGTNYGRLDTDCEPELRQTLLPNGHGLRASQNESAPLGRSSD